MKKRNEYLDSLPHGFFDSTPKAVFAALAVSLAARCGDGGMDDLSPETIGAFLTEEWRVLHANGIIPQDPDKVLR